MVAAKAFKNQRMKPLLTVGIGLAVVIAGFGTWRSPIHLTVHEPGFKVLKYKFSEGSHHTLYPGSQAFGKLNAWMEEKWSVNFIGDTRLEARTVPDKKVFLVRFAGRPNDYDLYFITAVLQCPSGATINLDCHSRCEGRKGFGAAFVLPPFQRFRGPFQLHFKRKNSDTPLATWRINRLN